MTKHHPFHLFEVTGVELEYMIVDRDTLNVMPVCDQLLQKVTGEITSDFENGTVAWSNELVNHVVELKTNGPVAGISGLHHDFHTNITEINNILSDFNAQLMPGGAHPWMNPHTDTHLWQHEYNEIYSLYNRIFDCRGHGWSNLQSTHINLPFSGDEEFGRLHAAIRMVLPIISAIAASTPFLDGRFTGFHDSRLEAYRHNQQKIPSIAGVIVPEQVFSKEAYFQRIFAPIIRDIAPFDKENVLDKHFLNSRGAISRFDRGAIEIRVVDNQEAPLADLAIVDAITGLVKLIVEGAFLPFEEQIQWHENRLATIFQAIIRESGSTLIDDPEYLKFWGCNEKRITAGELWHFLKPSLQNVMNPEYYRVFSEIVNSGSLAQRLLNAMDGDFSMTNFCRVYRELAGCLGENRLFGV
jgi:carboxylate-amine ligase